MAYSIILENAWLDYRSLDIKPYNSLVERLYQEGRPQKQNLFQRLRRNAGYATFVIGNVADLVTTRIGLQAGNGEGNPLMSGILEHGGFTAAILYKLAVIGIIGGTRLLLTRYDTEERRHNKLWQATLIVCNALVLTAVANNIVVSIESAPQL